MLEMAGNLIVELRIEPNLSAQSSKHMNVDKKLGHYTILGKIGAGGMGEVYLARDTKLDRRVALKILPPEFADDKDRMSRFVREAKSASALNHPNIITIYEIGEADGTHFIATEFIDGQTLGDYAKANPLDYKAILEIAIQTTSALQTAHAANIVHRDIKPDNIMIRADGLAKILDFGIAKLATPTEIGEEAATAIQGQTQAGMIIGTPNYMSPEQARGKDVDHQTDIFSFGVVFYEMLSGTSPFKGETVGDVIAAVLMTEPRRLANVPLELETIIHKSLQKDKRNRYQSANDLLRDLKEFKQELEFQDKLGRTSLPNRAEVETHPRKMSATAADNPQAANRIQTAIVVLPFTNISTDADNEYFSDGLTEEIISDLSKIRSLRVISRNSAMKLKGTTKDLKTITEELHVRYVIDGSVRKAGQHLRISVQLIDGATDANLWAEQYTGSLDDIFEIQESVSRSIAQALKITLTTGEIERIEERPIGNAQAYDLYLQARAECWQANPAALDRSIELLKQGLEIIGANELLYAALSYTYYFYFRWISKLDLDLLNSAEKYLKKTFAINPASSHGFTLEGLLSYSRGQMPATITALMKAVESDPANVEALLWLVVNLNYIGRGEESKQYADRLISLDPLTPINVFVSGLVYMYSGDFAKSLPYLARALAIDDSSPLLIWSAVVFEAWGGKLDESIAHADRLAEIAPGWVYTEHALFLKHALRGEKQLAIGHYTPDFDKEAAFDCHFALHVAHCFALIGEHQKALDFLEIAVRAGMLNYRFLSEFDPLLENIRREPRFLALMTEAKQLSADINKLTSLSKSRVEPQIPAEAGTLILQGGPTGEASRKTTVDSFKSIAVMPFAHLSADEDNDYFCDGLAEELLNALSKIEDLKVAARTSSFSFKGKNAQVGEIGAKLGVKHVLEGSVRKSGSTLRISVQLVNASDGYQLWSERYDREMKDIFDVQDEIALAVVDALKVKLFGDERAAVLRRYTDNAEVYEIYLKGRYQFQKHTPEGWQKSVEHFQQAIDLDPEYALGYAGLSSVLIFQSFFGFVTTREAIPKAKETALRALEIDSELDEAHLALGQVSMFFEWDLAKAEQEYQAAIRLNPKSSFAHHQYGLCLAVMEKPDQAIIEAETSMRYEPLSVIGNLQAAAIYMWSGQDEGGLKYARRLIEIAPEFFGGYFMKGVFRLKQGRYDEAIVLFQQALSFDSRQGIVKSFLGRALGLTGKRAQALGCIKELQADLEHNKAASYQIAAIYSSIGDLDKTFEWLEQAFEERNGELIYLKLYANWRDGEVWGREFRTDRRFRGLLRRIGLPTDKTDQTDESLEANTAMLSTGKATSEESAKGLVNENAEAKPPTEPATNSKPEVRKPKSKWWLFGLLGLLALVVGIFADKYFTPTNKQIESIAVMPFVNESGNAEVEYLSDGMTETLISSLSNLANLNVKPRSSVFRFKGKETDPQTIGKELNVQALLNGRVVQRGDDISLFVELIDISLNKVVWSQQYNRKQSDLVRLQSDIARDISSNLKTKLSGAEEQKVTQTYTANAEAYQLYLKGKFYWNKRTGQSLKQAAAFYRQAIELDPNYALAFSGLAETYVLFSSYDVALATDSMPQAKAAALRALEIDEQVAEAHTALGFYLANYEWDRVNSEKEYRRAIALKPNYATAHHWLGADLSNTRRFDDSILELRRAEELDPLSLIIGTNLADTLLMARRYDDAVAQCKRTLVRNPDFASAHQSMSRAYGAKGMYAEAIAEAHRANELDPTSSRQSYLALWLARSNKRDEALKILGELKQFAAQGYVSGESFALIYIGLGDNEQTLYWLEKNMESHAETASVYAVAPEYDGLRSEPRFKAMLKRMNLPE